MLGQAEGRENMLGQSRMAIIVGETEEHSTPGHVTGLEQGQAKNRWESCVNKVKERVALEDYDER